MKPSRDALGNSQELATRSGSERLSIVASNKTSSFKKAIHLIGRYAAKAGLSERRNNLRVSARELSANCASGPEERQVKLKDISPTGAFLLTSHRWMVGTNLLLVLENGSRSGGDFQPRVRLRADVVRFGEDGVGVNFVHERLDAEQWRAFVSKAESLFPEFGAVEMLRTARTLAFVHRLSPTSGEDILRLFGEELHDERIERALEIALNAEEMVDSRDATPECEVVSSLLLRILCEGSKSNEALIRQCWSGLLAASSIEGSNPREVLSFAVLLSKIESTHTRILAEATRLASRAGNQPATGASPVYCAISTMKQVVKSPNVSVIEGALNHLYELGLLELTMKPFGFESLEQANLTLTKLGMSFHRACCGQQQTPELPEAAATRAAS